MVQGQRHYGMDWLRIGAFALLIFYHIGMYFVWWDWHVNIDPPVDIAAYPMLAVNPWRLALLFVVSGFASAALLQKLGSRGRFLRSRTARLLVPLAFGIAVIVPPQPWAELVVKQGYADSFWHFWTTDYFHGGVFEGLILPTWNHLWFVAYLWFYTILAGLLLTLPQGWRTWTLRIADRALSGPGLFLVPLGYLALILFVLFPGAEETHAFFDDLPTHLKYFPIFLFGMLLWQGEHVWTAIRRHWRLAAIIAIAAYGYVAGIEWRYPGATPITEQMRLWVDIARLLQGWCAIVALIGLADRYLDRDHPWRATLNEAVFPFYIVHQTVTVLAARALLDSGLSAAVQFVLLTLATFAGCAAFYWGGRRIGPLRPFIGLARRDKLAMAGPRRERA